MRTNIANCISEVALRPRRCRFAEVSGLIALVFFSTIFTSRSAEAQYSRGDSGLEPAVTTCNINTGVATGLDAGTCANPVAVCDGVTNNAGAFNKWDKGTTTNANGQLIEMVVSGVCNFTTGNAPTFTGLKKARLMGYGATLRSNNNQPALGAAGGVTPAGICHKGLSDPKGCSARVASASAGATSVTLLDTSLCSRFTAGRWAVVTGFDIQGAFNAPYGYPPNPHFFDFVRIGATTNCASAGQITLGSALKHSYLSTWPQFNTGNAVEADQGGPATIYALDPNWGGAVDIRGVTIDSSHQSIYQGRSVTLRDVTMTGGNCIIPSQNETFEMINSTGTNCAIEVDKIIDRLIYRGTTLRRLMFQSSSTNLLEWDGGSLILDLNGTPKVANISNLTTPIVRLGPYAYGTATSATCSNCAISNEITGFGIVEKGPGDVGANQFYSVKRGVFSYPNAVNVTGFADNGSGKVRLTVPSTTGWVTGAVAGKSGLFAKCAVSCVGGVVITVVDGTTIDLLGKNFADYRWTGGGFLYNSAEQVRWAVPGTNVLPVAFLGPGAPAFQVTGVTQDNAGVHIATTLPGGYPVMPLNGGQVSNILVQAPKWTCTNCTGNVQMTQDFARAPPGRPLFSYANRTWTNDTSLSAIKLWGRVTRFKINVTQAYTGATNPMRFNLSGFAYPPNTTALRGWNALIDLRTAGLRQITPTGVTCDMGRGPVAGGCGADSGLALSDPASFFAQALNLSKPNGSPTDQPWSMSAEFITDQGVVP
jgi:hypothetical protein